MLRSLRQLRTWYKLHKWTSIITGIALLMWLITSITMTWDNVFVEKHQVESALVESAIVDMSPAEALGQVDRALGKAVDVKQISLRAISDLIAYEIETVDQSFYLVDTASGELFEITPVLAEEIARSRYEGFANVVSIDRIDFNSRSYPFGPVPVYRVAFDDVLRTHSYVSITPSFWWNARSGDVRQLNIFGRLRDILGAVHTFDVLKVVIDDGRIVRLLLWATAIATLVAALLGYYLALPKQRRARLNPSAQE